MQQKLALGEQLAAAAARRPCRCPPATSTGAHGGSGVVEVAGRYDAGRQILIDNRVHAGRAGYHVVTPLVIEDGRAVLVNRGFVPAGPTRDVRCRPRRLNRAACTSAVASIRRRRSTSSSGHTVPQRGVWQNLDPVRFAAATGLPVLPVVIEQVDGPADGLVRDWPVRTPAPTSTGST